MMQNFDLRETVLSDGAIVVRPAHPSDEDTLTRWFADPEIYRDWNGEPMTREDAVARCGVRTMRAATVWPFIIMREHAPAGFLQAWQAADGGGGLDLFIAPEWRRKGMATRALSMLATHLRDVVGWTRVTADPRTDNAAAIACFTKAGFEDTGKRQNDVDHVHEIMEFR